MTVSTLWARAGRAYQRRAARWLGRRPFTIRPGHPLISFTFDDFPRSALLEGGEILQRFEVTATYYAALGITGQRTPCGEMFDIDELPCLIDLGHELGCHTYDHCPAWETDPAAFDASVLRNAEALREHLPHAEFRSLSYPISYPRPETKELMSRHFVCCRGGGQTFNTGEVDLNYLASFFLEQSAHRPAAIREVIAQNAAAGGWLIFSTHDVARSPSRFGCTPQFFKDVVRLAVDSGATILPVSKAWDSVHARVRFLG